ncbi:MAG: hypothetical protein HYY23_12865 [Verrucomicrobia bacterium]|nr:hypothetical protein [Verrucomicrobiota bacterium]
MAFPAVKTAEDRVSQQESFRWTRSPHHSLGQSGRFVCVQLSFRIELIGKPDHLRLLFGRIAI